ncbi:hypothetical protein D3C72_1398170 [compost metagenome]
MQATEAQQQRKYPRIPGNVPAKNGVARSDIDSVANCQRCRAGPQESQTTQRHRAEARDAFRRRAPRPPARAPWGIPNSRSALILHGDRIEPHPCKQAFHEAVPLRQLLQCIDDGAVHQPELGYVRRNAQVRHATLQAVGDSRKQASDARTLGSLHPLGQHDFGALPPPLDHGRDQLGRILKVRADRHHGIAGCLVNPGGQRGLSAEASCQVDHANPAILPRQLDKLSKRIVRAAIVDANYLELRRAQRLQYRQDACEEFGQGRTVVVEGHHQRQYLCFMV